MTNIVDAKTGSTEFLTTSLVAAHVVKRERRLKNA
jgi:hypothetical protein